VGGCVPDFAEWSGYIPIAALTIDPEIDVMCHNPTHALQQKTSLDEPNPGSKITTRPK
jgi:hypothetical protein